MAVRLPVILVQTRPPNAKGVRLTEEVVGQLIGRPGIDLMLIGPLDSLAESSTDRLTLESLSGDVAVLDWQSPEEILRGLSGIKFSGLRSAHPHDADAEADSLDREDPSSVGIQAVKRKVFAFDMTRFADPEQLIEALADLNSRRQVRTFAIGIGGPKPLKATDKIEAVDRGDHETAKRSRVQAERAAATSSDEPDANPSQPVRSKPAAEHPGDSKSTKDESAEGIAEDSDRNLGGIDLDQLLDQLDELDP